ncbi:hypothetical protein GCM10010124_06910 [Pilimelia terevasa]|uniref:FAD-dependent urate hydroxylase HpyO/Asp monooxygenase CreE-like FAD/NAD(P)-binding domain-containing protein n=1 Tax=Pilimelia terevasa TaxID=53372 RepID=A0A8J3BG47_9ACTN|nr:FAD/NAD(P)-binding protein [Pilimelia terevasa]GGK16978.1 hypothetical protein GCM10010124_06910 [Pilimelia terevasa]
MAGSATDTGEVVAVIGGGASGVLVSRELLRRTSARVRLLAAEPAPGPGVAYGAAAPWHLLNSPAAAMSADPDDVGHFLDWSAARGRPVEPGAFVARQWFGAYLRDVFSDLRGGYADRFGVAQATVDHVAVDGPGHARLLLRDGAQVAADRVVLAVGNATPGIPACIGPHLYGHPAVITDPWAAHALTQIPTDRPVLLLGSGLTAVDVALTLTRGGHQAPVVMTSRHGLLPRTHRRGGQPAALPAGWPPAARSLSALVRAVRSAAAETGDWRAVVDGLRPHLDGYWRGFTAAERERFLRHVARYWEVHRHRMAPVVADDLDELRRSGALVVRTGRLRHLWADADSVLRANLSDAPETDERFGAVINCTGPGLWPAHAAPVVRSLVAAGLARPGPYGLGLDVGADGAIVDSTGSPQDTLWAVGPARRGCFWETTALPEIRRQARTLADTLVARANQPA